MTKIQKFLKALMHGEWSLSLWTMLFGTGGIVGSFSLGAWTASATTWLDSYGPVAWVASGFVAALLFSFMFLIYAFSSEAISRKSLNEKRTQKSTRINILQDAFEGEIIHVDDLWSFQHQIIENKRFHRCRFVGPMIIVFLNDVTANGFYANSCNFIEIGSSNVHGVVGLKHCILTKCSFDCITFLVQEQVADQLVEAFNGQIEFVSRPKGVVNDKS